MLDLDNRVTGRAASTSLMVPCPDSFTVASNFVNEPQPMMLNDLDIWAKVSDAESSSFLSTGTPHRENATVCG